MRRLPILAAVLMLGACARGPKDRGFGRVGVYQDRITLRKDDGGALTAVDRRVADLVVYHVTLNGAPIGETLPLSCAWIDPLGHIAHQNSYTTVRVTKQVWPTHCRCPIGPAAAPGLWKVEMSLDGRLLRSTTFEVK